MRRRGEEEKEAKEEEKEEEKEKEAKEERDITWSKSTKTLLIMKAVV